MRVLHVIPSLAASDGGPAKAVVEMCHELRAHGHFVEIYTTTGSASGRSHKNRGSEYVHGIQVTYYRVVAGGFYKLSPGLAHALRVAVPRFDIVHINSLYQFPSTIAAHYCRKFGVPYILRPHGTLDPFLFRRHRLRKLLYGTLFEHRNLRHAAAVHFTSAEEMRLASTLGLRFRGSVVPLGVEIGPTPDNWREIVNAIWPELCDGQVILFLGRLNFKKGLDVLADAFGLIHRQRKDIRLVIAGPDNDGYASNVRAWLSERDCLSAVTFTGMVEGERKAALLERANVFVLPSYSENFAIAVVEAMGTGLPVVVSNSVNIWREIRDAGAGLIGEPTGEAFAQMILQVLDDQGAASVMGDHGRRLAREHFSWSRAGDLLLKLYADVAPAGLAA